MYVCEECGATFDAANAKTVYEDHGEYFGFPAKEPWHSCPQCGSTDLDTAENLKETESNEE